MKKQLMVDAGSMSITTEKFLNDNGGSLVDYRGNLFIKTIKTKGTYLIEVKIKDSWNGKIFEDMCLELDKGDKIVIGDLCYCFGHDKVGSDNWSKLLEKTDYLRDILINHKPLLTGGDGLFDTNIVIKRIK